MITRRLGQGCLPVLFALSCLVACDSASKAPPDGGPDDAGVADDAAGPANPLAPLPLIPWEGGPAYWEQFPITKSAGWSDPKFFPIVIWYNGISSNAEAQYDKGHGINSYIGMSTSTQYQLFADNGVFWLGNKLNASFPDSGSAWAGDFLDDETDGTSATLSDALMKVKSLVASSGDDGRFKQFNFTQIVVGNYGSDNNRLSSAIINAYVGPVSVDNYWYTMPNCTASPSFTGSMLPVDAAHCRSASSYGITTRALRMRNAVGGAPLKPIWNFIEDLNGSPDSSHFFAYITPGQLQGAVMQSIINEARGILYFNQSYSGSCTTSGALRDSQTRSGWCGTPQMDAMKEVDQRLLALAPVLNTQSYDYRFGDNLSTMLKWQGGAAYLFAMISGDAASQPGRRSFTLPPGLAAPSRIEVLDEGRDLSVAGGKFDDDFTYEYSYHLYKITP